MTEPGRFPPPGSPDEVEAFRSLQARLGDVYRRVFSDDRAPRTVVVIPSLTLDPDTLAKIDGVVHYEERMLVLLMLLKMPRTQVIYVTSMPVDPAEVDYYLRLVGGVPDLRDRLTMISLGDDSFRPHTQKILERPDALAAIRANIRHPGLAHMTVFAATPLERTLAVRLGLPMYACDPDLADFGTKTGSRRVMAEAGVTVPEGADGLRDAGDVVAAITDLRRRVPDARRVVVKLHEGFSGEGNAVVDLTRAPESGDVHRWVGEQVREHMTFEAAGETWERYSAKISEMGAIVEVFVEGKVKRSPSVQARVDPLGEAHIVSTHDQVLGGPNNQVFLGATFPADPAYVGEITDAGARVAKLLARAGVVGRFGVDFVSVWRDGRWHHYGLEINLRKGGTTSPYLLLEFLTGGSYRPETGTFETPDGRRLVYRASDNVQRSEYRGMSPERLLGETSGDHYHPDSRAGIAFHLMGPLPGFGKVGMMAVAEDASTARARFERAVDLLDRLAGAVA